MTHREAIDRVNGEEKQARSLLQSPWIHLAVVAFGVGVAWANLHAEFAQSKLELQAEIAVMKTDIHAMKVLACRSFPNDSVCIP